MTAPQPLGEYPPVSSAQCGCSTAAAVSLVAELERVRQENAELRCRIQKLTAEAG